MPGKHKIEHVTAILIALEGNAIPNVSARIFLFLTVVENGINLIAHELRLARPTVRLCNLEDITRRVSLLVALLS
jgi:hypothetical protein